MLEKIKKLFNKSDNKSDEKKESFGTKIKNGINTLKQKIFIKENLEGQKCPSCGGLFGIGIVVGFFIFFLLIAFAWRFRTKGFTFSLNFGKRRQMNGGDIINNLPSSINYL